MSIVDVLQTRAAETPDRTAYIFLADGEAEASRLSYAELDVQARAIGTRLRHAGFSGERALLLFPPGLQFITAFLGCLYSGVVAVPAYPPRKNRGLNRVTSIIVDAEPRAVLTTSSLLPLVQSWAAQMPSSTSIQIIATDAIARDAAIGWENQNLSRDALAFLQYTSGSTATPKGVMVTHGNIVANEEMIRMAFDQSESSIIVSWLPLYHDMGLIGGVLQPLYSGATCVLMPSLAFLQRPRRWLEAITKYRGTTSGGPNFAYDLCVRKIPAEDRNGLDLSSWAVAFNGAEPIRTETMDRFAQAFALSGFRRTAFYPCYGLAEATLFVTGGLVGAEPRSEFVAPEKLQENRVVETDLDNGKALVACGHPRMEQRVVIVDSDTRRRCPPDRIGEIWLAGPSVAKGYWNRPEETEHDFQARLSGAQGEQDETLYLRTGDLGFIEGGDLFVTGRLKDLIIVRGRNYYPQDIEVTVEGTHPGLRPGCGAAFSVEGEDGERVVVVHEIDRRYRQLDPQAMIESIRGAVAQEHELLLYDVVLIGQGTISKTSSGKIQRHACRASYIKGDLEIEASSPFSANTAAVPDYLNDDLTDEALPRDPVNHLKLVEEFLVGQAARILKLSGPSLDTNQPLVSLGLDSLAAMELKHAVEERFGVSLSLASLLDGAAVSEAATYVLTQLEQPTPESDRLSPTTGASDEWPLSYGQRGLWFLQRLAPDSAAYNIAVALKVTGTLDVIGFRCCFQALLDRHATLRFTFHQNTDGEPVQRVHESREVDFTSVEAESWDEETLTRRLCEEARRPFDLERGPLIRVVVFRRSADEHAMLVTVHHLVADFWSLVVLFDELSELYLQVTDNGDVRSNTVPLTASYGDFVFWNRARLAGPEGDRLWNYWRETLSPPPAAIDLPTDRPRPAVQSFRGASRFLAFGPELMEPVRELSRSSGASLFVVLLAVFKTLLYRYTGQSDLAVGCPVAGRSLSRFDNVTGYFVNPVVIRTDVSGDITFRACVENVRRTALGALEHQEFPFPLLAERLSLPRDPSRTPLFQVMFALQKAQRAGLEGLSSFALEAGTNIQLGPLSVGSLSLPEKQVGFDLTLMMAEADRGLVASLQYNCDLFDGETASRILQHLRCLLGAAVADPEQRIASLGLLTAVEQKQLLIEWNSTDVDFDRRCLLHELIEAQSDRNPDALALVSEGASLSYAELEQRANRLAHYLRRMGVGPETCVGVCLDRSLDLVVAILGVLKAGGAYLPLDPSHPAERLNLILQTAHAPIVITGGGARLPGYGGWPLDIESGWPEISNESDARPSRVGLSDHAAYLIFTSGSTGLPKGVIVPHRAVVNFLTSMAREPGLTAEDIFISVTTPSFDIFGLELFLPLMAGARMVLPSHETTADGARLHNTVKETWATAMQATPATWRLLIAAGWRLPKEDADRADSGDRRLLETGYKLLCGGEALPWDLADKLRSRASSVWNLYGPTETTIWSSLYELGKDEQQTSLVPIGKPIANTRLYVIDGNFQLAPVSVPGELLIGGVGLARGYWQLPALTAKKFLPDPFSSEPGARLYRTGDLARWRANGSLEFLGRLDNQVKVRGFRIELGEVEAVLASHPAVRQAVAVAWKDAGGDQRLVGYVVPADRKSASELEPPKLRNFLLERLPEPFVPSLFLMLESLPLTPNGKVDRKALPKPDSYDRAPTARHVELRSDLERVIADVWKATLRVEKVGRDDNFFDLGGHSILLAHVQKRLSDAGHEVSMLNLLRHPTVGTLAEHLEQEKTGSAATRESRRRWSAGRSPFERSHREIAIVGMAGRFPGARNVSELWSKLCNGGECISHFSDDELTESGISTETLKDPNYVKAGGVLEGSDLFDAAFFGFHPREAELMDPQHRIFLQCAWQALEDAGYSSAGYEGRIGVFAGTGLNTYLYQAGLSLSDSSALRYQAFIGNDKDFVATRVSYKLNLKGPSVNVQTACSTSLVAVHMACQSLLAGECEMALAGGVAIRTPQKQGYFYEEGGILSPDAHCRAFDKNARGTVFGSGVGVVVLKPLAEALADGDNVYAVVKGGAINNDGGVKIGYTAPSLDGQAEVIAEALNVAGVEPETISYVEAHGTGTPLGDPIEIAALAEVFSSRTKKRGFCGIGSVKTNIGHLDTAAGIAGLIKTVCALRQRLLPPSLHFTEPNPKIDFDNSPFYVNTRLTEWPTNESPRRAGVSSFGIGGTNVHVVLEEAPIAEPGSASRPWQLLTLSAKTASALDQVTRNLAEELKNNPKNLADVSYTIQVGRRALAHRRTVVCRDLADAVTTLESLAPERVVNGLREDGKPSVTFLFPGQGSQYVNMARDLHETEATFAAEVDACLELLRPNLDTGLRQVIFPSEGVTENAAEQLAQTALAQPALFVVEYALARLWMNWGVMPSLMIGHSIGEYVAACLSGVLSLGDALLLVAARGRLMQSMPKGAMVGVQLGESELAPWLVGELSLAAANGPSTSVVSGPLEAVAELERKLAEQEIACTRLHTSHAFHSCMMDPIIEEFTTLVRRCSLQSPAIPYISNLTGAWITASEATDPLYWGRHLRETVRFSDGVRMLREDPDTVLLEVGPGRTLSTLVRQQDKAAVVISSLPHAREKRPDVGSMLDAVGRLWIAGVEIDWKRFHAGERRVRVSLPPYPFEEQRYWIKPRQKAEQTNGEADTGNRYYVPTWRRSVLPVLDETRSTRWLVLKNDESLSRNLVGRLKSDGLDVTTVQAGEQFSRSNQNDYTVEPGRPEHYDQLIRELVESDRFPSTIVHAWNVTPLERGSAVSRKWGELRRRSFDSLIFLTQALERGNPETPVRIGVLSNNMQKVCGEQLIFPEKALLLGPVKVVPQEYPNLICQSIDLVLPGEGSRDEQDLICDVVDELMAPAHDRIVAYRGGERWVQSIDRIRLDSEARVRPRLRDGGVYLITGGFGGIGLTLAEEIARAIKARLVLIGRSTPPERERWSEWAAAHPRADHWTRAIRAIERLEEMGSKVLAVSADVSDSDAIEGAVQHAEARFGPINGVIHAAGVAGGGIVQLKTPDLAEAVLAPKVRGTLALESALNGRELDFLMLCSSINSIIGGFGQSDYCAANAFCDSFAQAGFRHRGPYVFSINWDRWSEVGMAVDSVGFTNRSSLPLLDGVRSTDTLSGRRHPLLDECLARTLERGVFVSQFSPATHWVLSEHRVSGVPTVPGAAYLEMARAAFAKLRPNESIEIRGVTFRSPMMVEEGETREVVTLLDQNDGGYSFRIVSRPAGDGSKTWDEHARGEIGAGQASEAATNGHGDEDVDRILRICQKLLADGSCDRELARPPKFITTGPRWESLKAAHATDNEALAVLDMDGCFSDDLAAYVLHPSLLDIATGFVQFLVEGDYLPLVYERLRVRAPIPRRAFSYAKFHERLNGPREVITCDVSILSEDGAEAVRVEGFSMKRVAQGSLAPRERGDQLATGFAEDAVQRSFGGSMSVGVSPRQGAEAFRRVLEVGTVPQIIVSTRDVHEMIGAAQSANRSSLLEELGNIGGEETVHARPPVSSVYTEPTNEMEHRIAAVWQRVLGIEQVGIHDNFFELGGTSLTGIQLVAELKKELKVDIPVVSIFEASTVAVLARYAGGRADQEAVFERVQDRAEKKKRVLEGRRRMANKAD